MPRQRKDTIAPMAPTRRQAGHAGRRALLLTAGVAAAGAGAWWAWRRGIPPAPSAPGQDKAGTATTSTTPASAAAPHDAASDASLVAGDTVTAAFWAQTFDTPDGKPLVLASFKGQPLLINFWATWCPPCVKEMPEIDQFSSEATPRGWRVLGLAVDGPTPVKTFLTKVRVGFAIGLAGFGGTEMAQALGNSAGGLPFTVLIDAQGRILRRKMGATTHAELSGWLAATPSS